MTSPNLPWKIVKGGLTPDSITVEDSLGHFPLIRGNAQFIVTACNHHASLVSALETLLADYESEHRCLNEEFAEQGIAPSEEHDSAQQARAVLSQLKGGAL